MKYEEYFKEFCKEYEYIGKYSYNSKSGQYDIIITKGDNHAGAFLTSQEYETLTMEEFHGTLEILHEGFNANFNK